MRSFAKPFGRGTVQLVTGLLGSLQTPADLTTTGDVTLTSTQDGPIVVQHYGDLTVDTGHTLTVSNRCKGLMLVVHGDLTVNGTITMTGKGAAAEGADYPIPNPAGAGSKVIINVPATLAEIETWIRQNYVPGMSLEEELVAAGLWPSIEVRNNSILDYVIQESNCGAGGAPLGGGAARAVGNAGTAGTGRGTGGGGGGAGSYGMADFVDSYGGGSGTPFSGGSGGGGAARADGTGHPTVQTGADGADDGGAGGDAGLWGDGSNDGSSGGGAGNDGGAGASLKSGVGYDGEDGTGGLIVIFCFGSVTIGASGVISSNGKNGGGTNGQGHRAGGGGSGGGSINIFYVVAYSNSGTLQVNGGQGGDLARGDRYGGAGGAGTITVQSFTG